MWMSVHKNVIDNTLRWSGSPQRLGYGCRTGRPIGTSERCKPFQRLRKLASVYGALALATGRYPMPALGLREIPIYLAGAKPRKCYEKHDGEKFNLTMEVILEDSPDRFGKVAARGLRVSKERNPVDHLVRIQTNGIDFFKYASKICCHHFGLCTNTEKSTAATAGWSVCGAKRSIIGAYCASALPLRTHLLPGFGMIPQLEARRLNREHAVWFLKRCTGLFYN